MFRNKKILITGANGFVGSHLLDNLSQEKSLKIFCLKKVNANMENVKQHLFSNNISWIDGDLTDYQSINRLIEISKPDYVFHLAALSWVSPSFYMPSAYMTVNALGTINLFEAIISHKINPRIFVSCTPEEFGDVKKNELPITEESRVYPVNHYAASKVAEDAVCMSYFSVNKLNIIRMRAFNHEGPRRKTHGAISSFAYQIASIEHGLNKSNIIQVGNLSAKRNFTHVLDMIEAYKAAIKYGKCGELYLAGSENIYSIKECLSKLIKLSTNNKIKYKIVKSRVRKTELNYLIGSYRKFKKISKWSPKLSIDDILLDTLNYWRDYLKNIN